MAYDIVLLDPAQVPTGAAEFQAWFHACLLRPEPADGTPLPLTAVAEKLPGERVVDVDHIALCLPWAGLQDNLEEVTRIAAQHGLAVYDHSGSGRLSMPSTSPVLRALETRGTGEACRTRGN